MNPSHSNPSARLRSCMASTDLVLEDCPLESSDLGLINQIAPVPLRAEQLYTRSMYLCSSQPCPADGCQFTRRALEQIARLIIGQSVLCGHNRAALPIARFYKACVVDRGRDDEGEPVSFVQAWFYWLRETSGAEDLRLNIDGGIYREVSLAWRYQEWYCSVCKRKNGECGHAPGRNYEGQVCYRLIDEVVEVLEGSLVYKAADRETVLAGCRGEGGTDLELLLLCPMDDPLLLAVRRLDLLTEEWQETARRAAGTERAEAVWLRLDGREAALPLPALYLKENGVCLVDKAALVAPLNPGEEQAPLLFQQREGRFQPLSLQIQEADDGTVWTL